MLSEKYGNGKISKNNSGKMAVVGWCTLFQLNFLEFPPCELLLPQSKTNFKDAFGNAYPTNHTKVVAYYRI